MPDKSELWRAAEFEYTRQPGTVLRGRISAPKISERCSRTLLIVHGACEHGGRYLSLAGRAERCGWRVLVPDLQGHGLSTGELVHVDRFHDYLDDLDFLLHEFSVPTDQLTVVGCSMGGLISIRWHQRRAAETGRAGSAGLCLLSPLLGIKHPIPAWKKWIARRLGHHFPRTRFRSTIHPDQLTHDAAIRAIRQADPLLRKAVSARWYLEVAGAMTAAFEEADQPLPPTRIYQAGADSVVDPLASRAWAAWVERRQPGVQIPFHRLDHWFHELLNEVEGRELELLLVDAMDHLAKTNGRTTASK